MAAYAYGINTGGSWPPASIRPQVVMYGCNFPPTGMPDEPVPCEQPATTTTITWLPSALEQRVAALEAQVKMLLELIASLLSKGKSPHPSRKSKAK